MFRDYGVSQKPIDWQEEGYGDSNDSSNLVLKDNRNLWNDSMVLSVYKQLSAEEY